MTTHESWSSVVLIIKFTAFHSTFMILVKEQDPALLQVCSEAGFFLEDKQMCESYCLGWASQDPAACSGVWELSTSLCPAASQSTASVHMTHQWKECLSPDLTVGLYLSSFPHSVRTGSFPIWHGRKTASALGDLTQLPQVSKKSNPWHVEQLLFIQTSWGPFGFFWKPQDIVLQESVCLSKLNSLSVTSSASLSLPWMP